MLFGNVLGELPGNSLCFKHKSNWEGRVEGGRTLGPYSDGCMVSYYMDSHLTSFEALVSHLDLQ